MKKLLLILLIIICLPLALIMAALVLAFVLLIFGGDSMLGLTVIDNVMAVINGFGGAGLAALVGLTVLLSLLIVKWRRKY